MEPPEGLLHFTEEDTSHRGQGLLSYYATKTRFDIHTTFT